MTDFGEFTSMLEAAKIGHSVEKTDYGYDVVLETGDAGVKGYGGFSATFVFNEAGQLRSVGIWE